MERSSGEFGRAKVFDPFGEPGTIQRYEAMHAIRKGQARRIGVGQVERRLDFIAGRFQIAR
jgi:hypothetical protein